MELQSDFDKAVYLLNHLSKYPKEVLTAQTLADQIGKSRPSIFYYRKNPDKIPLTVQRQLARIYDQVEITTARFNELLSTVKTRQMVFEDTQEELVNLIEDGLKHGDYSDYTKRIAKVLCLEIKQPNSDFLNVLMERLKGYEL